jgi:hypothetical protein
MSQNTTNGQGQCALDFQVKTTASVSRMNVAYLLCSAFEGGSNYWCSITKFVEPKSFEFRFDEGRIYRHYDFPLNDGGAVYIGDCEDLEQNPKRLDLQSIEKGLQVMAEKYPHHWQDLMNDNDDATTGDVFLQCCLFGEIVFG